MAEVKGLKGFEAETLDSDYLQALLKANELEAHQVLPSTASRHLVDRISMDAIAFALGAV